MNGHGPRGTALAPLLLALLAAAGGCLPVVTHGPRVEPGLEAGLVLGWGWGSGLETPAVPNTGYTFAVGPPWGAYARYGFTPEQFDIARAFHVGAFVPVMAAVPHTELDLYVEATARGSPHAAGAGVLASLDHVTPYVQYGRDVLGLGVHTTQSVARFVGGTGPDATIWMPGVAARRGGIQFFVQGGLGRERLVREGETQRTTRAVRFVLVGAAWEIDLDDMLTGGSRRPPRRWPPPPPPRWPPR